MLSPDEKLIVIGPTPPPIHGVAFFTPHLVEAVRRVGKLAAHLDTRDDRPVLTTGRIDPRNVWLAIRHAVQLLALLARNPGAAVYLPLSQDVVPFLRDAVFIWSAAAFRRRVIVHVHGGRFGAFAAEAGSSTAWLIARTLGRVDEAWVLTSAHVEMFDGLLSRSQVRVLENTVEDLGEGLGDGNGAGPVRRILFLSNLLRAKGCFDLLDAVAMITTDRPLELRFAGEANPAALAELRARAEALRRRGIDVRYEGVVTGAAKRELLSWADVFAFPSRYSREGQPLCVLEAMSAGLAIVTTDHSGIPLTVRDEREALIVPPGDTAALADAITRLLEEPELPGRLGAAARRRYEERYRPERFREAVAELLVADT